MYFIENYKNEINDNHYNQIRNLFYVACSRTIENLFIIYIADSSEAIDKNIREIFGISCIMK